MNKVKTWWSKLTGGAKVAIVLSGLFYAFITSAFVSAAINPVSNTTQQKPEQPTSTQPVEPAKPVVTTKTETEVKAIGFETTTRNDNSLPKGETQVVQAGAQGERTITYEVTYTDGVETGRKQVKSEITKKPVNKIVANGTYVKPKPTCDPNYSGGCVPIASDVDCGGGSGNGPEYFYGTAEVTGYDIYDLDRDNDGYACE